MANVRLRLYAAAMTLMFSAVLPGCSFSSLVADHSVDYNRALRKVSNANVLLNALRARDRLPMQFAAISRISGDFTFAPSASITAGSIPLESETAPALDVTGTVVGNLTYISNPSYDVVPLDSQEFLNGILTPLEPKILEFYISQGWPKELLFHLFFEDIKVGKTLVKNDPDDPEEFGRFQLAIKEQKINIISRNVIVEVSPLFDFEPKANLKHLVDLGTSALDFEKSNGRFRLIKRIPRYFICTREDPLDCVPKRVPLAVETDARAANTDEPSRSEPGTLRATDQNEPGAEIEDGDTTQNVTGEPSRSEPGTLRAADQNEPGAEIEEESITEAHLRSVQGIIYYLGEILRVQNSQRVAAKTMPITVKTSKGEDVLFNLIDVDSDDSLPDFVFKHNERRYGLPKEKQQAGRSSQVVELVSQLIGLQKQRKDLPTTQAIREIGR